ncbi:MAG: phosphate ABC transporter permease PstA [Methanobrevibacter sp.]|uniref:phosphate ABC transporter permease PstA n=1 Tax=Methanobrevibacter sp. TaxID=66852 RepID=UPI0025E0520A|nr:phosphate ABC transporter permease PstA [Methanobrevibacter sp.]MBR0270755.1 phosphate ABC transporter permease PstA [Methanobrevibacter sp.]
MDLVKKIFFTSSGMITVAILLVIVSYILIKGLPFIDFEFIFSNPIDSGKSGGIFPMIISSLYLLVLTALIAVPVGVGSAIYMTQYCKSNTFVKVVRFCSQTLSAIPSIIYGLFGFAFLIMFLKLDWSLFTASVVLAIMSVPTIFQVSEISIDSVPKELIEASFGLGACKSQAITSVILPSAISGIFTGIILALTRAISEAAAVMYVVGSTFTVPLSIFDAGRPLPLHLYILASEGVSADNAYATASVLIIIVLVITVFSNYCLNRYQNKMEGL